ncbi:phage holin family protein [Methylobacterium pseudosasicola]|uniref:Putative Holin-X, holin superfamily III n=1 Tax=Methylobacterium pseudosasicola TaxID=582667 RepID=A0A1I4TT42_9HYPH|nr:phage holin family protein [Methylobacterium pseudosasicola]SFM79841.1 Putative Holin-X, holin superfamily III [Methylobacterium pseudosasicola]
MAEPGIRSIPTLVGDAVRELRDLVADELALFRAEMAQGVHRISLGLGLLLAAAVLAIAGLFTLLLALVKGIAVLVQSDALAALIVGGTFLLLALVLGLYGRSRASLAGLEPTRTGRQIRQDARVLTHRPGPDIRDDA